MSDFFNFKGNFITLKILLKITLNCDIFTLDKYLSQEGERMKYCVECKKLYSGSNVICADCNKKFKEIKDINEPVLLTVIGGVERNIVSGALKEAQIPFIEKSYDKGGVSNEIVTGYDAKLLNIAVEVPYSAIPKAYDAIVSVGIKPRFSEDILEEAKADIEQYKEKLKDENDETMSDSKRTTVKVLSAIAFIVLIALAVYGTDYVTGLIKNLFGG